jgi:AcrR family transcriptional regulator
MEESRKKPKQERSRVLVDAILTAAIRVFSSGGPEQSTTTRIADRAGVSVGSLYQYFKNRDELLGAMVDRIVEENVERFMSEMQSSASPAERIDAMVRSGLDDFLGRRDFYAPLMTYAPILNRFSIVLRARARLRKTLARELRAHAREGSTMDFDVAAFVILNAFMGVVQVALHDMPGSREALHAELVRLFTRYLLPEATASGQA